MLSFKVGSRIPVKSPHSSKDHKLMVFGLTSMTNTLAGGAPLAPANHPWLKSIQKHSPRLTSREGSHNVKRAHSFFTLRRRPLFYRVRNFKSNMNGGECWMSVALSLSKVWLFLRKSNWLKSQLPMVTDPSYFDRTNFISPFLEICTCDPQKSRMRDSWAVS